MEAEAPPDALAEILGHAFRRRELLQEALIHPSLDPSDRGRARFGYERLEFLGDRVLGLVIAEWLIERFPKEPEGELAKRFTVLVQKETLSDVAAGLGLGRYVQMSPGEADSGGRDNSGILADVCEAVIAALYLDGGLEPARRFVRAEWADRIESVARPPQDPKTALQEWAQGRGLPTPCYDVVEQSGPDHKPRFHIAARVPPLDEEVGQGSSKRAAEQEAARRLLVREGVWREPRHEAAASA